MITKNALIRYKVLDSCFRNVSKRYFIEDLISECEKVLLEIDPESDGISLRQIRSDIAFMKSPEGWNIELGEFRDGKKMYYRYTDPGFSINQMPLNDLEINQLQTVVDIISQFSGMPQFAFVHELIPKLRQGMVVDKKAPIIIEFDGNQYLKGIEYLGTLHNAILYKKALKIQYQPYESNKPDNYVIHPYYLKQYNNRWFLFGLNEENNKADWNMPLDRIVSINESKNKYKENKVIDWQEYFEDMVGVTRLDNKKPENIVLHFYGRTAYYIETKPIHGSQKSKRLDASTLEVRLHSIINYELERLILSYAGNVKVISPASLVKQIKSTLYSGWEYYE